MSGAGKKRDLWSTILFSLLLLSAIAVVCLGIYEISQERGFTVLAVGVVALTIAASAIAIINRLATASGGDRSAALLAEINDRLQMSDLKKRMIDRSRDREMLRRTIVEDIKSGDYEAALALVDEMAEQFGYVEEAEKYRQQIIDARARQQEQLIEEAIAKIEVICQKYDWDGAKREVDRLRRLFPDDRRIMALPARLQQARDDHKRELERDFLKAAELGDTEKAMVLLKELDTYLSPQEAEAYLETARGVIGQARENLAVRFRMAVSDRDWMDALQAGEHVLREFPNSKMADEVRDMMDVLRERAAGQRAAETGRTV